MSETVSAANLNNAINSLGKTALRIADERRDLLAALRNVINAADRYVKSTEHPNESSTFGVDQDEYRSARKKAMSVLQGMQS